MTERDVDVVVIGMGPGGEYAAGALAEAGLVVAGVEARLVGGECPYWGCVPSKMMVRAADLLMEGHRVNGMAGAARIDPDWAPVARRIRDEATDNWDDKVAEERFTDLGGILVRGHGRISAPGEVTVTPARPGGEDQVVLRARRGIVINTGSSAAGPPGWNSARCSRGSAAGSRSSRRRTGCCPRRSPRPGTCWPTCSAGRGSWCTPASMSPGYDTTGPASPSPPAAGN